MYLNSKPWCAMKKFVKKFSRTRENNLTSKHNVSKTCNQSSNLFTLKNKNKANKKNKSNPVIKTVKLKFGKHSQMPLELS